MKRILPLSFILRRRLPPQRTCALSLHAPTVNLAADGGYCISDFAMDVDVGYVAVTPDEIADCEKHARAQFFLMNSGDRWSRDLAPHAHHSMRYGEQP